MNNQPTFDFPHPLPAEMMQRIADARSSGKISDCAGDVLDILAHPHHPHAGRGSAIQISEMQAIWSRADLHMWTDRSIKGAVKELLEEHRIPVGSSRGAGCSGYYLAVSDDDIQASEKPIRGEIISLAKRLRALSPNSSFVRRLLGQLQLDEQQKEGLVPDGNH